MHFVSLMIPRAIVRALDRAGRDGQGLARDVGVDLGALQHPDELVDAELEEKLWRRAATELGEGALGLRVASGLGRGSFRGLELLCRSCKTLGEGFDALLQYQHMIHGVPIFSRHDLPEGGARFSYSSPHAHDPKVERIAAEFALASLIVLGRDATGVRWKPSSVSFRCAPIADRGPHYDLFQTEIQFGTEAWELAVDADTLALPMREADAELQSVLCYLMGQVSPLPAQEQFLTTVRQAMLELISNAKEPTLELIATALKIAPRVLQRRLQERGTSYQAELDRTRSELARNYLRDGQQSVPDIALLLGYSDARAFHRAFKRWTGLTPAQFRRQISEGV